MTRLTLLTVGTLKEGYLREAFDEYSKRLSAFAQVEPVSLKEEKLANESPAAVREALEAEGERLLAHIPEGAFTVALCVEGKELSSEELAGLVGRAQDTHGKLCFIIGSSYGLAQKVKNQADFRLSFSRLTFPHQLMRVILAEALYRSFTIVKGKKYHK